MWHRWQAAHTSTLHVCALRTDLAVVYLLAVLAGCAASGWSPPVVHCWRQAAEPSCSAHATVLQPGNSAAVIVQELGDLLAWLQGFGVAGSAFDRVRDSLQRPQRATRGQQPSLAATVANFASLREELHMTDQQVRGTVNSVIGLLG